MCEKRLRVTRKVIQREFRNVLITVWLAVRSAQTQEGLDGAPYLVYQLFGVCRAQFVPLLRKFFVGEVCNLNSCKSQGSLLLLGTGL